MLPEISSTIAERLGNDQALITQMARLFLEGYPTLIKDIKKAIAKQDGEAISFSCHTLKGSVGNFSDGVAYMILTEMEQQSAAWRLGDMKSLFEMMSSCVDHLAVYIRELAGG